MIGYGRGFRDGSKNAFLGVYMQSGLDIGSDAERVVADGKDVSIVETAGKRRRFP